MSQAYAPFVDRDTIVHRLDPRAKLVGISALFVIAYVFSNPLVIAVPAVVALALVLSVGGYRNLRRVRVIVIALFIVGFVVWPVFLAPGGAVLLAVGPVVLTEREVFIALGRSLRIVTFILGGLVFISTTTTEELVRGLRQLGVPYPICFAVGTALRLFPTFVGAAGTVRQAQAARGAEVGGGSIRDRLRGFIPLLIPVFMTAFRNIQTQSMALEARGFDPMGGRSFYGDLHFRRRDWLLTLMSLGVMGLATLAAVAGIGRI
jgi:energy-coupling factor transport system permease protein